MVQFQRQALEQGVRISADLVHQAQRFTVGADQDVLAIIEDVTIKFDATGAAAQLSGGFEKRHAGSGSTQFNRCGQPGPAAADDRDPELGHGVYPLIQVRQAIHSLRRAVSDVRWLSTWQPSRLISSSTVR